MRQMGQMMTLFLGYLSSSRMHGFTLQDSSIILVEGKLSKFVSLC